MADQTALDRVGESYSTEGMGDARLQTRQALQTIGQRIEIGMTEHDARGVAREVLVARDMQRGWHPIIVRIGANTVRGFLDRAGSDVRLTEHDLYFVDIGPIVGVFEGDAGDTFVVGDNPEHHRAQAHVREIWHEVREAWLRDALTGRALYDLAARACQRRGWMLNFELLGHRISEYPHKAHYKGSMATVNLVPSPDLWVLEIAIVHPRLPIGAFYEDTLLADG